MVSTKPKLSPVCAPDGKLHLPGVTLEKIIAHIVELENDVRWNHLNHLYNSRNKWLGVSQLSDCKDTDRLSSYALRLRARLESETTVSNEPPDDPMIVQHEVMTDGAKLLYG